MAFRCLPKTQFSELYLNPTNLPQTSIQCNYSKSEPISNSIPNSVRASIRVVGNGYKIFPYELKKRPDSRTISSCIKGSLRSR